MITGMLAMLVPVLAATALGAWLVAAVSAIGLWRRLPQGHRLRGLFDLGWLQFDGMRELVGPDLDRFAQRYVWALVVFFVAIAAMVAVIVVIVVSGQNSVT